MSYNVISKEASQRTLHSFTTVQHARTVARYTNVVLWLKCDAKRVRGELMDLWVLLLFQDSHYLLLWKSG